MPFTQFFRHNMFLFILVLLVLTNCNSNKSRQNTTDYTSNDSIVHINFEEGINNFEQKNLSEICDKMEYIPLVSDKAPIDKIVQLRLSSEYIFINSWYTEIMQFDRNGNYIRSIGRKGRGPGEFRTIIYFDLNEEAKEIYLGEFTKLHIYSFDGSYIRTLTLRVEDQFAILQPGILVVNHINRGEFKDKLLVINNELDTLHQVKFARLDESTENIRQVLETGKLRNYFTKYQNLTLYRSEYDDTIFSISTNFELSPRIVLNMGKHKVLFENRLESLNSREDIPVKCKDYFRLDLMELPEHIIVRFQSFLYGPRSEATDMGYLLYNKKSSHSSRVIPVKGSTYSCFLNDIDGGYVFQPFTISEDGAYLIEWKEAFDFIEGADDMHNWAIEEMKESLSHKHFMTTAKSIAPEGNPVLILARVK